MTSLTSVLSAVSATLAAVLSGGTLYLTGRREHRKWLRDALIEAYVDYLEASFSGSPAQALELRASNDEAGLAERAAKSKEARDRQMLSLTRLRLIAAPAVIEAAEQLHMADVSVMATAFEGPIPVDRRWDHARERQQQCRRWFIRETRRSLGLGAGADIGLAGPWRNSARPGQQRLAFFRNVEPSLGGGAGQNEQV